MSFQKIDEKDTNQPSGKKALILYGYNEDELNMIKEYGAAFDILDYILVSKERSGLTIGELLTGVTKEQLFKGVPSKRTIIINAFSGQDLQNFINGFKGISVAYPNFAVVTQHSMNWPIGKLVKELILESQLMAKQQRRKH